MSSLAILGGPPVRSRPFARWPLFDESEKHALEEVLESGVWGGYHPKVAEFEKTFAHFHGAAYGVATANGTVSLEAALAAVGVGPQDEVIVPPITFIATATAVLRVGAIPVFADIGPDYNLDPARVREAITSRTRALIPVHFAGRPADMDSLGAIAAAHSLMVIEDAAHAHGASWNGRRVGAFGHLASFSFQQSKNVTAGEGGILIGSDPALIESARSVCNQGRRTGGAWFEHVRLGTNYRMTAWQAAILLVQLSRLEAQLRRRAEAARILDERLAPFDFLEPQPRDARVDVPRILPVYDPAPAPSSGRHSQGSLYEGVFAAEGIPGIGGYPYPLYGNKVFADAGHRRQDCPEAERMCRESFWVSHEIMLSEPEDLEDFVRAVAKVAENAAELARSQEVLHRA